MSLTPEELADLFAIETKAVSKRFGAVKAVDGLSLSIPIFGMTSIVGPNGSGKSTLINLLSGVLPLDDGMVIIEAERLRVIRPHEAAGHGVTRTFQEVRLFDQISVWDNIMVVLTERNVFAALLERSKSKHHERAREILERVGIWEKRDSLASDLSYGQRKLLEIGRAIAMDAKIYLFDEPFAGLFPQMLEKIKSIMKQMRNEGHTIVFVSHNMDIVREMSDHIIVLDSGKLLLAGEVAEILNRKEVIEAYLGA